MTRLGELEEVRLRRLELDRAEQRLDEAIAAAARTDTISAVARAARRTRVTVYAAIGRHEERIRHGND